MTSHDPTPVAASKISNNVSWLVKRLRAGEAFTLTVHSEPVADITPRADRITTDTPGDPHSETERTFRAQAAIMIRIGKALDRHGLRTLDAVRTATDQDILDIPNVGPGMLAIIRRVTAEQS